MKTSVRNNEQGEVSIKYSIKINLKYKKKKCYKMNIILSDFEITKYTNFLILKIQLFKHQMLCYVQTALNYHFLRSISINHFLSSFKNNTLLYA